jgi:hypothetical protein
MAFSHGALAKLYAAGYDLSAFFTSVSIPQDIEALESTTFGADSKAYTPGLKDATLSAEGLFDGAEGAVDDVLSTALGSSVIWMILPAGEAFGSRGKGMAAQTTTYEVSAAVDGLVEISVESQGSGGAEPILVLSPWSEAKTGSGNGDVFDSGAASTSGGAMYVHGRVVSSTEVDLSIQDSADGSTGWTEIATIEIPALARRGSRIAIAGTIRRYVRAAWDVDVSTGVEAIIALHRS